MRIDTREYPTGENAVDPKKIKRLKILSKVATINGCLWTAYGWFKTYKDWPVIIANVPGVVFGLITVITIYIH